MTESDRTQIKKLWESRVPIEQIVRMLPYEQASARAMVKVLRDDGTLPKRNVTDMAIEKIAEVYRSGITDLGELSTMFGYTNGTIKEYLKLAGIKRERPKRYNSKVNDMALAIMGEIKRGEKALVEIANIFGVSRQYVHQLKKRMENDNENYS